MTHAMGRAAALVPVLAALAAVCVFAAPAAADTLRFNATADTYVDSGAPAKEHGKSKRLRTNGDIPVKQTFVRFRVAGLTGRVKKAALRLYVINGTKNGPAVFKVRDNWSERTTNWNNRPSRTSTPRDDKRAISAGRWVEWDVTPWVRDDGAVNFVLRGGGDNPVSLTSREKRRGPRLVVTTTGGPPPPPPAAGEPGPIAGEGYHQVFRDDFDGTSLGSAWTPKQFWEDEPRPGAIVVSDGTVKIRNARPYLGDQSITTGPYWFGDPVKKAWKFGYFEAQMRFTDAKGSWPAFWLISSAHATWAQWPKCPEPDLNFELDIMEYQGDEPTQFYGTEHRNTNGVCGTPDDTRGVFTKPARLAGTWHTYAVKWTSSSVTFFVDGAQQGNPQPLFDSGDQLMYMALTMQACGWDDTNACDAATPDPLETEVDYVTVWQQ